MYKPGKHICHPTSELYYNVIMVWQVSTIKTEHHHLFRTFLLLFLFAGRKIKIHIVKNLRNATTYWLKYFIKLNSITCQWSIDTVNVKYNANGAMNEASSNWIGAFSSVRGRLCFTLGILADWMTFDISAQCR